MGLAQEGVALGLVAAEPADDARVAVVGNLIFAATPIAGASPLWVLEAYVGGAVALLFFGVIAAKQQHDHQPIQKDDTPGVHVDAGRLAVVAFILAAAMGANLWFNLNRPELLDRFPVIGAAVLLALLVSAPLRAPAWQLLPGAFKGSVFLLALVWCASLMPCSICASLNSLLRARKE